MRIKFPIRYKFLAVTTLLLVISVVSYLLLASHIFRRDKVELVFDLNRAAVSGYSSEAETLFRGISDKMKLAAVLSQDDGRSGSRSRALLEDVLRNDSNVVFMAASYGFSGIDQTLFSDSEFGSTYGLAETFFKKDLTEARPIPFSEIRAKGDAIWNATVPDGPPLIGFAKSVTPSTGDQKSDLAGFAMIAYVRADRLIESFAKSRLNEVVLVNASGEILVHPQSKTLAERQSLADHPLFMASVEKGRTTGVLAFAHRGHEKLGAHSAALGGKILVLSQIDGKHAFSAVERLIQRSLVFAGIVLTLAFLAAIFFSRSLTKPINALVDAMKQVSKGELETKIDVGTRDEIAILATSFNSMLGDLEASRTELEMINRDLEQKVKDRTRRLEEQNLAVKKAQEALLQTTRLATVGEVAGRAAHEVLNPLTSIVNRLEKVRSRISQGAVHEVALVGDIVRSWDEDVAQGGFDRLVENWKTPSTVDRSLQLWQEDMTNIKSVESTVRNELQALVSDMDFLLKESQRINRIVQNMRELTRVKGDFRLVSARALLQDATKIMADLGNDRGVEFIEDFQVEDDRVSLDADEFIQVVTNLLRNSIQSIDTRRKKSDPSLRGEITVSTRTDGRSLTIDVSDNGVGISPEHQTKLFEIQFSTKSAADGTGLGLSISRRFVRAFGGDIALLASAPNQGCTFRIQLPLSETTETQRIAA